MAIDWIRERERVRGILITIGCRRIDPDFEDYIQEILIALLKYEDDGKLSDALIKKISRRTLGRKINERERFEKGLMAMSKPEKQSLCGSPEHYERGWDIE